MDPISQARFDELVRQEPANLTEADEGFLRARRSYLSEEQRKKFAKVLGDSGNSSSEKALDEMTWKELDAKATELGLNSKDYEKKPDIIAAIEKATAEKATP